MKCNPRAVPREAGPEHSHRRRTCGRETQEAGERNQKFRESETASSVKREPWEPRTRWSTYSCVKEFPVWLEDSARLLKDIYCCLLTYLLALPSF